MNDAHCHLLAEEFKIPLSQVKATASLIADGATVPFIARYRKEATGGLDEVVISGVETDGGYLERGKVEVAFYIDGTATAAAIFLDNEADRSLVLDVLPLADRVRIRRED